MQEFRKVKTSEIVGGLRGEKRNLENNAVFDWEPTKLLKDLNDDFLDSSSVIEGIFS